MTAVRSGAVWMVVSLSGMAGLTSCSETPPIVTTPADTVSLSQNGMLLSSSGGNLVLFQNSDGALVVDTRLVDTQLFSVWGLGAIKLQFLVQCHPQEAGDRSLSSGAVRVSHRNALPKETRETGLAFRSTLDLNLGNSKIHCYHKGSAFTDGDCLVYLPDDQVLVAGYLVQPGRHAVLDPGGKSNLRSWARVLRNLHDDFSDNDRLQVVPAHGKPGPAQLLLDQAEYLEQVLDFAAAAHRHGLTFTEMFEDVARLQEQQVGRPGKPSKALLKAAYKQAGR